MRKMFSKDFYGDLKDKELRYCPNYETSKDDGKSQYVIAKEKRAEKYKKQRNDSDYFVYKFVDGNHQIIYIGKTIRLPARMVQHFRTDSHLTDECYNHVKYVFYSALKTKVEMDIYEIYLIDKYRPQYNVKSVYEQEEISSIVLPELTWEEYCSGSLDINEKGTIPNKKIAVVIEDIRAMVNTLGGSVIDIRDRALILIGFAGAFRRSELVSIEIDNIEFNSDGLIITLLHSKIGHDGQGNEKRIPYGSHLNTCPVRSLRDWLQASKITTGPLFRRVNRHGQVGTEALSDQSVALIVKKLVKAAGLDERKYSGHSLRSGLITAAASRGVAERSIM